MAKPDRTSPARGELLLFDLDNTLFDREAAFRAWSETFVSERDLSADAVAYLVEADRDGHAPREELFAAVRARFGLHAPVDELVATYRVSYPRHFRRDPSLLGALDALRRRGCPIVIVTNGPPSQIDKIRATGLDAVVDGWCISDDVGSAKPDRAIFLAAAQLGGCALSGVMVGDTLATDIDGGRAVGLRTIWLARGRRRPPDAALPDVVVNDIAEALALLLGEP